MNDISHLLRNLSPSFMNITLQLNNFTVNNKKQKIMEIPFIPLQWP